MQCKVQVWDGLVALNGSMPEDHLKLIHFEWPNDNWIEEGDAIERYGKELAAQQYPDITEHVYVLMHIVEGA